MSAQVALVTITERGCVRVLRPGDYAACGDAVEAVPVMAVDVEDIAAGRETRTTIAARLVRDGKPTVHGDRVLRGEFYR